MRKIVPRQAPSPFTPIACQLLAGLLGALPACGRTSNGSMPTSRPSKRAKTAASPAAASPSALRHWSDGATAELLAILVSSSSRRAELSARNDQKGVNALKQKRRLRTCGGPIQEKTSRRRESRQSLRTCTPSGGKLTPRRRFYVILGALRSLLSEGKVCPQLLILLIIFLSFCIHFLRTFLPVGLCSKMA